MQTLDLTTALARLLTDARLREEFRKAPERTADSLHVSSADRASFCELDAEALEFQAQGLIFKRFHEVLKWLPQTLCCLEGRGKTHFLKYANTYWPKGHRRHQLDALEFCRYLLEQRICGVNTFEFHWLQFQSDDKKVELHFFHDIPMRKRLRRGWIMFYRTLYQRPAWRSLVMLPSFQK